MKPFTQGMTLRPGESADFMSQLPLPEGAAELIARGQLSLEIQQGPTHEYAPGKFKSEAQVFLGGRHYCTCGITFQAQPATQWQVFIDRMRRAWRTLFGRDQ